MPANGLLLSDSLSTGSNDSSLSGFSNFIKSFAKRKPLYLLGSGSVNGLGESRRDRAFAPNSTPSFCFWSKKAVSSFVSLIKI